MFIQWKMTHSPQLCVKTADNCENKRAARVHARDSEDTLREGGGCVLRVSRVRGNFTRSFVSRREVDCEQPLALAKNQKADKKHERVASTTRGRAHVFTRAFVSRRDERLLTAFLAE